MGKRNLLGNRIVNFATIVVCLATMVYVASKCINYFTQQNDSIKLTETPININEIKPIGKLYVYTGETEDYYTDVIEDVSLFSTDYLKCIQIMRQQINWIVDLNKVVYETDSLTDTILITLPNPEFLQSTTGYAFYSQEEKSDYSANGLIEIVKHKIKNKYYTKENENKAREQAKQAIGSLVKQLGKEPVFKN